MIKYAAVPIMAFVAACSAEVENGETADRNDVQTLSVNNLIITEANTVSANSAIEAQPPAPDQRVEAATDRVTAPPAAPEEPTPRTANKLQAESAPKAGAAPPAEPTPEAKTPESTCSPEHREMGHC